jgi:hypothetical protein
VSEFLDILGVRFAVRTVPPGSLGKKVSGLCDSGAAVLSVDAGLSPGIERRIKFHEVAHAIDDALGLDLTEAQVIGLAVGLASIPQLELTPEIESAVTLGGPIGLVEK